MNNPTADELRALETLLTRAAGEFSYPHTPELAGAVRARLPGARSNRRPGRRLAYAGATALAIALVLFAVPPVRAVVLEFIRLGAVWVIPPQPTAESISPVTATPAFAIPDEPANSPDPLLSLAGETTLEDARSQSEIGVLVPTYPSDLGDPDRVYVQYLGGTIVVLVWLDPQDAGQVRLSLHALGPGVNALKGPVSDIQQTRVNGGMALWTDGEYMLAYLVDGQELPQFQRLVEGRVLIWMVGDVTYRLETDLPLEEAVRMAESLR